MSHTSLATLSDNLLVIAILGYLVAMMGHTAELAFASRGGSSSSTGKPVVLIGRFAVIATVLGVFAQIGCLIARGYAADRVPWGNMYEFVSVACLVGVISWLGLLIAKPVRHLGLFVLLPVVLLLGLAGTVLYAKAGPLVPALNSYWLKIHVSAAAISSGIFMLGFVTAVLYLIRQRYEEKIANSDKSATPELRFPLTLAPRLPKAETLERVTFRIHALAFPLWTFAIIAGAIWAEAAWTRYWGWDPKETWAFISWVIYATYLHARATAGWRGKKAIFIVLLGWSSMMVNLFAVNLVYTGLHSYAGIS
jgi:cytochrome c-type biogenesis protein CcsB